MYTSGVIATKGERAIALFFTGRQHAGENLADVLKRRAVQLKAPVQMSDALAANTAGDFKTLLAHCLAHARRGFVEVVNDFPEECRFVLETLRDVYRTDVVAKQKRLTPAERLSLHQLESGPRLEKLAGWLEEQIRERRVEPNSGLGAALKYMRKHWPKLTLFLREPGVPLDNNVCERALKKALLHRKNSLFYRSENGAHVGDLFMSLIHTVELHAAAAVPFARARRQSPSGCRQRAARLACGAPPPLALRAVPESTQRGAKPHARLPTGPAPRRRRAGCARPPRCGPPAPRELTHG